MRDVLTPILAMVTAMALVPSPANAAREPGLTVDRILSRTAVEEARFVVGGNRLVYVETGPADIHPSAELNLWLQLRAGRLRLRDLKEGRDLQIEGVNSRAHYWLGPRSPGGGQFLVYEVLDGRVVLAVLDPVEGRVSHPLNRAPEYGDISTEFAPAWIDERTFVASVLPSGRQPSGVVGTRFHADQQSQAWRDTWEGRPSAVVLQTTQTVADTRARSGELVRVDLGSGRTTMLAEGVFSSLRVSPSGRYVAGLRIYTRGGALPERNIGDLTHRTELMIVDLNSDAPPLSPMPDLTSEIGTLVWSGSADRLAVFARTIGAPASEGRFHAVEAADGSVRRLSHGGLELISERERGLHVRPERAAWIGEGLLVAARQDAGQGDGSFHPTGRSSTERTDWCLLRADEPAVCPTTPLTAVSPRLLGSGADTALVLAGGRPFTVSAVGVSPVGPEDLPALSVAPTAPIADQIRRHPSDRDVVVSVIDGESRISLVVDETSNAASVVRTDLGHRLTDADQPSGRAAVIMNGLTGWRIDVLEAGSNVVDHWGPGQPDMPMPRSMLLTYTLPSGAQVGGCLLLPQGRLGTELPPVVLDVYPWVRSRSSCATPTAEDPGYTDEALMLAGQGYAVLSVATPPEALRGEGDPQAGLGSTIDAAIQAGGEAGVFDPDRVVAMGISQGAVTVLRLATQSRRVRGVIAVSGWADHTTNYFSGNDVFWNATYPEEDFSLAESLRYDLDRELGFGGQPEGERLLDYVRSSPLYRAHEIAAPVLLMTSDFDGIPSNQFDIMYAALERAGRPARYVRFSGEGHRIVSPGNVRTYWSEVFAFLDRTIGAGRADMATVEAENGR